jgi:hypothetical protein
MDLVMETLAQNRVKKGSQKIPLTMANTQNRKML